MILDRQEYRWPYKISVPDNLVYIENDNLKTNNTMRPRPQPKSDKTKTNVSCY